MTGPDEPLRDYRQVGKSGPTPAVAAGAAGAAAQARLRRRWRRKKLGIVTLAVAVATLALLLYPLTEPTTLPLEVRGVWRTDAVGYEHRRFELWARSVTFQVGILESAISVYPVSRVQQSRTSRGTLYRVEYFDAEDAGSSVPLRFDFIYRAALPAEIVFANQRGIVWTRGPRAKPVKPAKSAEDEPDRPPPPAKRP